MSITNIISQDLCIGDSLPILNFNFDALETNLCNLSSVSNSLNDNLNSNLNIFSSNIFNLLNLLNTKTTTGIQSITPGYIVVQYTDYQCNIQSGTFVLPTFISNANPSFILFRADYESSQAHNARPVFINGIGVPLTNGEIDGINSYAYLTLAVSNIYTYYFQTPQQCYNGVNETSVIRIIGYY